MCVSSNNDCSMVCVEAQNCAIYGSEVFLALSWTLQIAPFPSNGELAATCRFRPNEHKKKFA